MIGQELTPAYDLDRLLSPRAHAATTALGLEGALKDAWREFRAAGWDFALLAAEAQASMASALWGYTNAGEWAVAVLGFNHPSTFYKYARLGSFLRALDDQSEQRRWMAQSVTNALEALPVAKFAPETAIAILESSNTAAQVRAKARAADPDQHHEAEFCTISARVSTVTRHDWQRALNLIRVQCGIQGCHYPSDDDVITYAATIILQAPELQVPEMYRADVESGSARCHYPINAAIGHECGSWANLERHHVVLRSRGGHDGPLVWVCAAHHRAIHEKKRGFGWREMLAYLHLDVPEEDILMPPLEKSPEGSTTGDDDVL